MGREGQRKGQLTLSTREQLLNVRLKQNDETNEKEVLDLIGNSYRRKSELND